MKLKRYNLALPIDTYEKLQKLAEEENTTLLEVIKRLIKIGMTLKMIKENSDKIILKKKDCEVELLF